MDKYPHAEVTWAVIGAAMTVHNALGPGYLEVIYEKALACELEYRSIPFRRQVEIPIFYRNTELGTHILDMIVDDKVVVELKSVKELAEIHTAIALSYLAATGLSVALLLNFQTTRLEYKRLARRV